MSTEIDEVPGPVRQRVLHPAEAHLLPAELARVEDHLRARVDAGDLASGKRSQIRRVVSAVPKPSSRTRFGANGIASIVCVLELVVARHLGADHLQVASRGPSRNSAATYGPLAIVRFGPGGPAGGT